MMQSARRIAGATALAVLLATLFLVSSMPAYAATTLKIEQSIGPLTISGAPNGEACVVKKGKTNSIPGCSISISSGLSATAPCTAESAYDPAKRPSVGPCKLDNGAGQTPTVSATLARNHCQSWSVTGTNLVNTDGSHKIIFTDPDSTRWGVTALKIVAAYKPNPAADQWAIDGTSFISMVSGSRSVTIYLHGEITSHATNCEVSGDSVNSFTFAVNGLGYVLL